MTPDEKLDKAMELLDKAIDILDKAYEMHRKNPQDPSPSVTIGPGIPDASKWQWPYTPDISLQNCENKIGRSNFDRKHEATGEHC